jgi:hypothetical protein
MSARTAVAKRPKLKIAVSVAGSITPAHLKYHTKYIKSRSPGFDPGLKGRSAGVSVAIAEWDWQHSAVYLGIHSRHKLDNGHVADGAFEEPISLEQLDQIIEMLIAVRAKAAELGILTPRAIPKAMSA